MKKRRNVSLRVMAGLFAFVLCLLFPFVTNAEEGSPHPLVKEAMNHLDVPYRYGGNEPTGFDPSGFVQYVFKQVMDFSLPRTAKQQYLMGDAVERNQLEAGDLVFFSKAGSTDITHVAIYMGDDQLIHATASGGISVTYLEKSSYWSSGYYGAKRISGAPEVPEGQPIVQEALKYQGIEYVFGGETPESGFDCSGFVQYVFNQAKGIYLPRSTDQQWQVGETVALEELQPGDVVFFSDTYREGISHNGIYMGDNQFIHANRTQSVTISYLSSVYWQEKFTGAKRFNGLDIPLENPFVSEATKYIGEIPYVSGGQSPEQGFDTAGFIQYVFKTVANYDLPRYAEDQWKQGEWVERTDLKPGDLVFFQLNYLNPAIYIGNDQVVHVTLSDGVRVTNFRTNNYWSSAYYGAKRIELP